MDAIDRPGFFSEWKGYPMDAMLGADAPRKMENRSKPVLSFGFGYRKAIPWMLWRASIGAENGESIEKR